MKKHKDQIKLIFDQTKEIPCPAFHREKIWRMNKAIKKLAVGLGLAE